MMNVTEVILKKIVDYVFKTKVSIQDSTIYCVFPLLNIHFFVNMF